MPIFLQAAAPVRPELMPGEMVERLIQSAAAKNCQPCTREETLVVVVKIIREISSEKIIGVSMIASHMKVKVMILL